MIAVGVDTHKHWHVAVALDVVGQLVGEIVVAASGRGYRELVVWLAGLGGEVVVGIEGAGSYGAGLCRHLQGSGISVVEVERPRRRDRRAGKSDRVDALLAAKRVVLETASPHRGRTVTAPRWASCWSRIGRVWMSAPGCSTRCRVCT
jgi:transposase